MTTPRLIQLPTKKEFQEQTRSPGSRLSVLMTRRHSNLRKIDSFLESLEKLEKPTKPGLFSRSMTPEQKAKEREKLLGQLVSLSNTLKDSENKKIVPYKEVISKLLRQVSSLLQSEYSARIRSDSTMEANTPATVASSSSFFKRL